MFTLLGGHGELRQVCNECIKITDILFVLFNTISVMCHLGKPVKKVTQNLYTQWFEMKAIICNIILMLCFNCQH